MRNYLLSLVIMIAVYFIHAYGMNGGYMHFLWLDIVSHGLVCFGIATCIGACIQSVRPDMSHKRTFIIAATFLIGFAWELLEVYYNISGHPLWTPEYYFDTTKDLIVDTIAATIGSLVIFPRKKNPVTISTAEVQIQTIKVTSK